MKEARGDVVGLDEVLGAVLVPPDVLASPVLALKAGLGELACRRPELLVTILKPLRGLPGHNLDGESDLAIAPEAEAHGGAVDVRQHTERCPHRALLPLDWNGLAPDTTRQDTTATSSSVKTQRHASSLLECVAPATLGKMFREVSGLHFRYALGRTRIAASGKTLHVVFGFDWKPLSAGLFNRRAKDEEANARVAALDLPTPAHFTQNDNPQKRYWFFQWHVYECDPDLSAEDVRALIAEKEAKKEARLRKARQHDSPG